MASNAKKNKKQNPSGIDNFEDNFLQDLQIAKKEIQDFKEGKTYLPTIDELLEKFDIEDGKKI